MNDILRRLYGGDILSRDSNFSKSNKTAAGERFVTEWERLKTRAVPEDKERFEELEQLDIFLASEREFENFSNGFRLGTLLMCQVFTEDRSPDIPEE